VTKHDIFHSQVLFHH